MKKGIHRDAEMRNHCDFTGEVRGKYACRYAEGTNVVVFWRNKTIAELPIVDFGVSCEVDFFKRHYSERLLAADSCQADFRSGGGSVSRNPVGVTVVAR